MRKIRSTDTSPELVVRRLVHKLGFRYRLHVPTLPGKPDMVFPRLKKIIDVRGCFWHQHGKCIDSHIPKTRLDYWAPKLDRNVRRDAENVAALKQLGFRVLVIWECETADLARITRRVSRFLGQRRPSP